MSDLNAAEITKPFASIKIPDPDASESTIDPKPPRANFPLPLELRELIYEHLLDAKYIRLKRHTFDDPAYKFHTNILAVNHTICADAERLLDERNTFINAFHTLDRGDADTLMREIQLWVPLVSWKYRVVEGKRHHFAETKSHKSLQIRFAYNSGLPSGLGHQTGHIHNSESLVCIFLAADLQLYCSVLSSQLDKITGPKLMVLEPFLPALRTTLPDSNGWTMSSLWGHDGHTRPAPRLKFLLHSTKYKPMNRQHQTFLLAPFRSVIGASMRVVIDGDVVDTAQSESVKKRMSQSLTCVHAEYWACFEKFEKWKTTADSTALGGELDLAIRMYKHLQAAIASFCRLRENLPFQVNDLRFVHFFKACRLLTVDMLLSLVHLYCTRREHRYFNSLVTFTLVTLRDYYNTRPGLLYDPAPLKCLADLVALYAAENDTLPLQCINFRNTSGLTQKPRFIVGWVDVRILSQVSDGRRDLYNLAQTQLGLPLTRWFDIDDAMGELHS